MFVFFLWISLESRAIGLFSLKNDRKTEKALFRLRIAQTQMGDVAHKQTIIWWQLFAGHEVGFGLMKRKNKLHGMIIKIINMNKSTKMKTNAFIHAYLLVCYLSQTSSVRHGFPFDVKSLTKNRTRVHRFCIKRIFPNLACMFDFRKLKSTRDVVNQCISYVP